MALRPINERPNRFFTQSFTMSRIFKPNTDFGISDIIYPVQPTATEKLACRFVQNYKLEVVCFTECFQARADKSLCFFYRSSRFGKHIGRDIAAELRKNVLCKRFSDADEANTLTLNIKLKQIWFRVNEIKLSHYGTTFPTHPSGFVASSSTRISQCRCGPVESPVVPTSPTT